VRNCLVFDILIEDYATLVKLIVDSDGEKYLLVQYFERPVSMKVALNLLN